MIDERKFRDMVDKGLISVGRPVSDLSKLTIRQAVSCEFLSRPEVVDYLKWLDYDGIDWAEWGRLHGN